MNKNQLQQGDVIMTRVTVLPPNAKLVKKDKRGVVLAEGEATGHHHRIKHAPGIKLYRVDDLLFLETKVTAILTHEEHNPITVDPGIWQIGQVVEYDYFTHMQRKVID